MKYLLAILSILFLVACSKTTPIPPKKNIQSNYVNKKFLKHIDFHNQEVIPIKIKNSFYYIRQNGKIMKTLTFEGKADKFVDGLARTKLNGKIGFFNRNLEIVLKPIYDFAFPFHNGISEICMGCKEDSDELLDGGKWEKINREGLVIQ